MTNFINSPCPPILFLIFNRPHSTSRVFDAIRKTRPSKLYIAADGARKNKKGELENVNNTRQVVELIDWPCEVHKLYRDENLGCKVAVSSAISWFFENVESGIILEDDCLPNEDFFKFCGDLLERYRDDDRIGLISGTVLSDLRLEGNVWDCEDYIFSRYFSVWGWATWRRVWKDYDVNIENWQHIRKDVLGLTHNKRLRRIHAKIFDDVFESKIDTWDYQVSFLMWTSSRSAILPRFNLIENIGFGAEATHTVRTGGEIEMRSKASKQQLTFPLIAPPLMCPNRAYQDFLECLVSRPLLIRAVNVIFLSCKKLFLRK